MVMMLVLGHLTGFSQQTDAMLFGDVKSAVEGTHIPYATIQVKGTNLRTVADASGHFQLTNLPLGEVTVVASFTGYKSQEHKVTMQKNKGTEIFFSLEEDVLDLSQVVVTGTRTQHYIKDVPIRTEVITQQALINKNANNLFQALEGVPGVRVEQQCQSCNFSMVRMQGLGAEHTQVLLDGEPVYSGLAGVYGLEQMGMNDVDRIEIVKGAGSALYGSSAVAGAINLISKEPTFAPSLKADVQLGSYGFKNYNASASIRRNNIGLSLFAQRTEADAIDQTMDGMTKKEVKHKDGISDRVNEKTTNLGFGVFFYNPFAHNDKLIIRGKYVGEERFGGVMTDNQYLNPYTEMTENINTNRLSGELVYQLPLTEYSELNFSMAYVNHKRRATNDTYLTSYMDTHDGASPDVASMRPYMADENTFTPSLTYQHRIGTHNLLMGVQGYFSRLKETGNYVVTDGKYYGESYVSTAHKHANEYGFFLQDEWNISHSLTVVPGLRMDGHRSGEEYTSSKTVYDGNFPKTKFNEWSFNPRLAVKYELTEEFILRANIGTGFRAPYGFSEDLHLCSGSPRIWKSSNLKAEKSLSFNLSADYYARIWQASLNLFRTNLRNKIQFADADENVKKLGYTYQWENVGDAYVQGIEIGAKINPVRNLSMALNLTFNQGKLNRERADWADTPYAKISRYVSRFPKNTGDLTIEYTPHNWTFTLTSSLQGKMYIDYISETPENSKIKETNPFVLTNCRVAKKINRMFTIYGGGKNIFSCLQDERHTDDAAFMYAPVYGAMWYAGVSVTL